MNTDPSAVKILCYGDSNTWGQTPDMTGRFPADVRWTGVLQAGLGDRYYVIEEGLGGRTTNLDHPRKPWKNGREYFIPCLDSHDPLDLVILMLGTNDLKDDFMRSAEDITEAVRQLVGDTREKVPSAKVVVVSPILINPEAEGFGGKYAGIYGERSAAEARKLAGSLKTMAEKEGVGFFDAATVAEPGVDGIHFTEESHRALGKALVAEVRKLAG